MEQMALWLQRREAMWIWEGYVMWLEEGLEAMLRESGEDEEENDGTCVVVPTSTLDAPTMSYMIAKTAPFKNVTISQLGSEFGAVNFIPALTTSFVNTFLAATSPQMLMIHMTSSSRSLSHSLPTDISVN